MDAQRQEVLDRLRCQRGPALLPFGRLTWSRCLLSVVTYALFLSDVLRTGVGVAQLSFPKLETNQRLVFGPYNYPVVHLTTDNASSADAVQRYWTYKYDTTSLAMRAVASALQVSTWPPCVHYVGTCDEPSGLSGAVVFAMIDELIEQTRARVSQQRPSSATRSGLDSSVTLRIKHAYRDRLSDAVLPSIFYRPLQRTCQASFFTSAHLRTRPLCDLHALHPYACRDHTSNYDRLCDGQESCPGRGSIEQRIASRMSLLQRAYPNASLQLVVLDSLQDFSRGGLLSHGRRDFDVVTLVRVRPCDSSTTCSTIAVDDYRYEGSVVSSSEGEWFPIIALMRSLGQFYACIRVAALIVSIVAVERGKSPSPSLTRRIRVVIRTFFIIPSHIVVYGSSVPVVCYVASHVLDSTVVYEHDTSGFNVLVGLFEFDFVKFFRLATVSMRTVWLVALGCHVVAWISTHRSWSRELGVFGVPELFIAFVSSFTVAAHVRIPGWRDCRVLQANEIVPSQRVRDIKAHTFGNSHGSINTIFLGSTTDYQFIGVGLAVVVGLALLGWVVHAVGGPWLRYRLAIVSHTRVPYSSSWLWPSNALVVNWANSIAQAQADTASSSAHRTFIEPPKEAQRVEAWGEAEQLTTRRKSWNRKRSTFLMVSVQRLQRHATTNLDELHDRLLEVDHRSRGVLAFIMTLNLTVMSDPVVFTRLRRNGDSRVVGVYESQKTGKLWLLPLQSSGTFVHAPLDWDTLRRVAVFTLSELAWSDLLHCG
ncbi:hypothetical protein ATCC90586_006602 [Pythium insidiosum]|nr:hypothetical protein ATCC90586_006602 [Pythium insidiosum]